MALVAGAGGWLGIRLVRALVQGLPEVPRFAAGDPERPVRCLVREGEATTELASLGGRLEIATGDVTRPDTLAAFFAGARDATLFNTAGVIHPTAGIKQLYAVNDQGVGNLIEAARAAGVRRLIHVSSNSPFGCNAERGQLFDEESPYHPYMHYGRSKMLGEKRVLAARADGELHTVVVRSPWFYGPNQPARQTLFFEMIRDGKVPLVGDGGNLRSMAYVDNICQGLLLCEAVEQAGDRYWIADERPYPMAEIIDTVERVLERDFNIKAAHERRRLPNLASKVAWLLDKMIQGVGAYQQKLHVLSEMNKNIACSVERAKRELGYSPYFALEEGMRRSIAWLLEQGAKL